MTKSYRICSVFIIMILLFTGCQKAKNPSSSSTSATPAPSSSNTSSSSTASGSTADTNASGTSTGNALLNIVPGNAGSPVKGGKIAADKSGNIYSCNMDDEGRIYILKASDTVDLTSTSAAAASKGIKLLGEETASDLLIANDIVYYTNRSDSNKIYSINTDGTGKKMLVDEPAYNMIMMGSFIFYINDKNIVCVYDESSNNKMSLNISSRVFDSDGDSIYFEMEGQDFNNSFSSIKINGSGLTKISDDVPMSIVVQAGVVYYVSGRDGSKIYSISVPGNIFTVLNQSSCSSLTYNNGWIYYINNTDLNNIYKIKPDGTNNTKLSSTNYVKSYAILGNNIYFNTELDKSDTMYKIAK